MSDESKGYELSLELPAAHRGVRIARNVVRRFARLSGLSHQDTDSLLLVTSELLGNSIDHGGGEAAMSEEDMAGDVRMRMNLELARGRWVLRVTDQGGGDPADVERLLAPDGMPDLEDERGRGFFLMAQMVDRMEVERSADGRGLTIIATKGYGADG